MARPRQSRPPSGKVEPFIGDALGYLELTVEGRQWIANLYCNVFEIEHGRRRMGPQGKLSHSAGDAWAPTDIESCISAVGPSQPTELRSKYLEAGPCLRIDQRQIHEHADASYPLGRLLRTRSERPRGSARKSHDNTPAPHSITSAAQGARLGPLPVGVTHGQGRGARRGWRGRSMSGGDATRGVRSEVHARASDRGTSPPWRKRPA